MSKFAGKIGIQGDLIETSPGIWENPIREEKIIGDMERKPLRWRSGELSHDSATANHVLSFIASQKLLPDIMNVLWVEWNNKKWSVKNIEHEKPRVRLTLGGAYNG
jgi:hypothetical protein